MCQFKGVRGFVFGSSKVSALFPGYILEVRRAEICYKEGRGWFSLVFSRPRFARAQLHTPQNHPLPPIQHILFFLMHAQKWPLFLPETREENPLFGVHTKNVSQKIRQRKFCTNCKFSQRWSWLPILSGFHNELDHNFVYIIFHSSENFLLDLKRSRCGFCHCLHYRRITSRVSDRIRCRQVSS